MSPDFDRNRPFHEISRPISSRHLGRLLTKYGFFDNSKESLPNIRPSSSVRSNLVTGVRPGTSYSVPTVRATSKESLASRSQSAATTLEHIETEFAQPIYSLGY